MKIYNLLRYVDDIYENTFSESTKLIWINQIEAELQTEVLLLATDGIVQYGEEDLQAELIAPAPFDKLYPEYLIWRIMLAQGEAERANNQFEIYNAAYLAYVRFVCNTIHPASGKADALQYYLTAYQIAVKHGYAGTEKEWVEWLKGPTGDAGAGLHILGQVESEQQLPVLGNTENDIGAGYLVGTGENALLYIWNGTGWFYKQRLSGLNGKDGESVTVKRVTESGASGGENLVEFSDGSELRVKNGEDGYTPQKGIDYTDGYTPQKGVDYTDGTSVSVASVTENQESGGNNVVRFTDGNEVRIKNGKDGYTPQKGVDYTDGTSVSVASVTENQESGGDNVVRFTDGNEVRIKNGKDGYTPQKGVDYEDGTDYVLTDADKQEIAELAAELVDVPDSDANVKNVKSYGATGDGVTDDTAAIAAAIEDLGTGDTLYFPAGVYRVSKVDLKSNMTVQGDGWCSVIKLIDNAPDDYTNCLDIEGEENVIIRDIKLDGNRWADGEYKQASTGASKDYRLNGIRIRASSNIRIENVWMHNNGYHGCVMTKSRNVVLDRCRVTDNGFRPIHGNTQVYNCQITNCVCENNGLGLQGGSGALNDSIFFFGVRDLVITNNIIKSNRRGCITVGTDQYGMADEDLTESGNITITGNVCECYEDLPYVSPGESDTGVAKDPSMGIAVYGSSRYKLESVTVTGNTILRANRAFYIYSQEVGTLATINVAATGNTVKDCSYGIYAQDVSGVVCSGNQFRGLTVNWIYGKAIEDCQFSGNLVYAMDINQVFRMYDSKNVVIQSNDIIGNRAYAIYVPASNTGCVVTGNTMYGFTLDNPISNPNGYTANNVPGSDTYTKAEINAIMGSYITDIDTLVGGDA